MQLDEVHNLTRADLEDLAVALLEQQERDAVKIDTLQQEIAEMEASVPVTYDLDADGDVIEL